MIQHRTCALCSTIISKKHRLCTAHYLEYRNSFHEPWLKSMIEMDLAQERISARESYSLTYGATTDLYGSASNANTELLSQKNIGRPPIDWKKKNKVLELYDSSLDGVEKGLRKNVKSLRNIANEVGGIDHCTVRGILRKYRP